MVVTKEIEMVARLVDMMVYGTVELRVVMMVVMTADH